MNIIIHPLAIIYILLSLIFDRFQTLFFLYLFGLIHELSHVLMGLVFKVKTTEVILYPTGFSAKMEDYSSKQIYKQILIILAGPLSYIFSLTLINILFYFKIISIYGLRECNHLNLLILLFNLLPCFPLDGGKLIDIIIAYFLSEYKTRIIRILLGIIVIIFLIVICRSMGDYLFVFIILSNCISNYLNLKKDYFIFLLQRKIKSNNYKNKLNKRIEIYRYRNNYYIDENKNILNEHKIIDQLFLKNNYLIK